MDTNTLRLLSHALEYLVSAQETALSEVVGNNICSGIKSVRVAIKQIVTDADEGEPDDQHGGSDYDCSSTNSIGKLTPDRLRLTARNHGGRNHFA
jgi:hypothetical protein